MFPPLTAYKIILGSKSPRRQLLLKELGIPFTTLTKDTSEDYPADLKKEKVALYLSELKAQAFESDLTNDVLVITADTIVCVDDLILGKPTDEADAIRMLHLLSGRMHEVITAVCLRSKERQYSFWVKTDVHFKRLSKDEIRYYVTKYAPYDKAGAYGVQEWIGFIGIEKINGSYFNVMGLPLLELYQALLQF